MTFDVAVIGGGLSGLAAAVELSRRGATVAIIEQSSKLGGRCYSYRDATTDDIVDNGQHLLIGAYHNTLRYLDLIGTREFLRVEKGLRLPFHHPEKGFAVFEMSALPKPLHLTAGILKFKLLSLTDRRKMLNVGLALNGWSQALEHQLGSLTIDQWLSGLGQSEEAKKCFWNPIAVSVMNELPERASALLFARSLRAAFLGKKSDSYILVPTVGQTELYVNNIAQILLRHSKIFFNTEVTELAMGKSGVVELRTKTHQHIKAKWVISAIPHYALDKMISNRLRTELQLFSLDGIRTSPIVSIHLWFDLEFMPYTYIGLIGGKLQWVFNRRKIMPSENHSSSNISAVISGAYDVVDLKKEQLVQLSVDELREVFPASRKAKLVHSVVIKEKRATFSPMNDSERFRPSAGTLIHNFVLAGDWTNTGLPATIESAVVSGFKAAAIING